MIIEFGDYVKFVDNEKTRAAGVALKEGVCVGFTTPSVSNIEIIGDIEIDYAICVELKDNSEIIWATQNLLEFIGYGEGQVMEIGNIRVTRRSDGNWKEEIIDASKENSNWIKRLFKKK